LPLPPLLLLPGPFTQRPRLGSRILVRNNFSLVLPALCRELSAWQCGPRAMAAQLLLVHLLAVEAAAERHLHVSWDLTRCAHGMQPARTGEQRTP
jgi:hypothetical protein